jgi:preprotein translocase subunit SecA
MSTLLGQYDKLAYLHGRVDSWSRSLFRPRSAPPDSERLERIERLGREYREASDAELRGACDELKQLHRGNHSPVAQDGTVETAFALLREASRRTTGLVHYTEQLLGGLALVRGAIAEMATGEGKTLAISLPALVFSLAGKGVHVVTVNSYLARRDYEFTKPMLDLLGVSVGLLPEGSDATLAKKRAAYECDITYAVGYELGFDYMRDQLAIMRHPHGGPGDDLRNALLGKTPEAAPTCQRDLAIAIIDEVDSVLIDEAGCPLLISESSTEAGSPDPYLRARDLSRQLREGHHFLIDRHRRAIELTGEGRSEIHLESHQVPWDELRRPWEIYLRNALKADHLFHRDDQYVVMDGKVVIVDEFTGRRFADRTWREGLHQAVEAKEAVEIRAENSSAASITRQRYFALYETVCGLTGTASESAGEFWRFFRLPVVPIPLHRPCRREILADRIFASHAAMDEAISNDIVRRHERGQPVLVGTRTIRDSERIAARLRHLGIPHRVLSAKQDAEEDAIVATAGEAGSVLIATNMAGRGTHIVLSKEAEAAGGLHVIAVEKNESARIDRQLIGRGARQGQPGSAQTFLSADDALLAGFSPGLAAKIRAMPADPHGELPGKLKSLFDDVQGKVERLRYEGRLRMAERDKWLEETRRAIAQ